MNKQEQPLTDGQLEILNRLAAIQAELECVLREAKRAKKDLQNDGSKRKQ